MLNLFFGSLFSTLTTLIVVGMIVYIIIAGKKNREIKKWGWLTLIFIIVGTGISGLSAVRDAYMMDNALFAPNGLQSTICSICGGLIFLTGIVSLFVRAQRFRKVGFFIASGLFLVQVITIEASRITMLIGGEI
jgi:hypothetical protein